jgi:hypothetical protein
MKNEKRKEKRQMTQGKKDTLFAYAVGLIFLIVFVFLGTRESCGQEYFKWRWSDQSVMQMPDASGLHFVGSAYLAGTFDNSLKWWQSDLQTLSYGVLWEIKDGLIPYERAGVLGGEGFSWGDILMDASGLLTHRLGVLLWNRIKYHRWSPNKLK